MKKIEVVKQQDLKDCGACSLSCIIKYYGGYVPLEKIREDTLTNLNGTTAFHIIKAAKNYGFEATGVKVESILDQNIYLPAIAHLILPNGYHHFVVIYKIMKKDIWLMDPAKGKIKMPIKNFITLWDNILILFNPITEIPHYNQNTTISSLLGKLIQKNKKLFLTICFLNTLLMIFTILSSFYFQTIISSFNKGEEETFLIFIIILFAFIFLFKVIFTFLKNYYLNYFEKNLDVDVFTSFLSHIFKLPLKFMQNRTTGEIISRVEELSEIKDFLTEAFTNIFLNSILFLGSLIVLSFIHGKLLFLLCFVIFLYLGIGILFSRFLYHKVKENIELATDFNTVLIENVEMNTSIHNLNLTDRFLVRLENKLILMLKGRFDLKNKLNQIELIKNFIYELGIFLVMSFGFYLIYQNELDLLKLITFNSISLYTLTPVKDTISILPRFYYLKASFHKLSDLLQVKEEEERQGIQKIKDGGISFNNVSYSYNQFTNILDHIHFQIAPKEKVLLIGPSGSGKSTICNLICEDLNYEGVIKFDFASEKDYMNSTLKRQILYVGQNEKLFSGTIYDNIVCNRNITDEDFQKVVDACMLEEIVEKRPNRYQSYLNASLNNLSGGERQRIILARALLKNALIIVLDEALSEVNIGIEKKIIQRIKTNYQNSTLIYISHKDVKSEFKRVIEMEAING